MDLMKLAGLKECGLCCEIMSDDGKMMRTDELISFAGKIQYSIYYGKGFAGVTERYLTILVSMRINNKYAYKIWRI